MTVDALDDEDLGAELDDEDYDPAGDDADTTTEGDTVRWYAGTVIGGPEPYPGKMLVSRFPSGVLLIRKDPAPRAWVFDYDQAGGVYRCRADEGMVVDQSARWQAAEGPTYEVRAYDDDFAGDQLPGPDDGQDGPGGDYDEVGA